MEPSKEPKGKPLAFWLIIIGVIVAVSLAGLFFVRSQQETGAHVEIYQDGTLLDTFSLEEDRTVTYESPNGGTNTIVIEDGKVRMSEASCPDQVCVRHGPTDQTADPIVCLPNQLVVEVVVPGDQAENQLDGVS